AIMMDCSAATVVRGGVKVFLDCGANRLQGNWTYGAEAPTSRSASSDDRWPMTVPFPGGVADTTREIGFIRLAGDEVLAVDLRTGKVTWRQVGLGRPIGAEAEGLVTIRT